MKTELIFSKTGLILTKIDFISTKTDLISEAIYNMITQTYLFSLIQRYTHYIIFFTVNFPPKTTNTRNMKKLLRRWPETNMMAQAGMTGFLFYQYLA